MRKIFHLFLIVFLSYSLHSKVKKEIPITLFVARPGINISQRNLPEPKNGYPVYQSFAVGYHEDAVSFEWDIEDDSVASVTVDNNGILTITPLKEGVTYVNLKMYDKNGIEIDSINSKVQITVGNPNDKNYNKVAHSGSSLINYDGTPMPVILPSQGNLEQIALTEAAVTDNRQANDIKVNLYKGNLTLSNNVVPLIKGSGIDGINLSLSYFYSSNANEASLGWHSDLGCSISVYTVLDHTKYNVNLPDGRQYRFRSIPIPLKEDMIVPDGRDDDVNYSSLTFVDGTYRLTTRNGSIYYFSNVFEQENGEIIDLGSYRILMKQDRLGNGISYEYMLDSSDDSKPKIKKINELIANSFDFANPKPTGRSIDISHEKELISITPVEKYRETIKIEAPDSKETIIEKELDFNGNGSVEFIYPDKTKARYEMIQWRIEKIVSPNGDEINVDYVADDFADLFELPNGEYGKFHYVKSIEDDSGKTLIKRYFNGSANNKLRYIKRTTVTDMAGRNFEYYFNKYGQVTKREFKNASNIKKYEEEYEWLLVSGAGSFLKSYTDLNGVKITHLFSEGNPVEYSIGSQSSTNLNTIYEYNDKFDIMTEMQDPMGRTWKNLIDDETGLIVGTIFPNATKKSYNYNSKNQLIRITDENGNHTNYDYNSNGLISKKTDQENNITQYFYDESSNLIKKTDPEGNSTEYEYDKLNRVTEIKKPYATIIMEYDNNGNLLCRTDEEGSKTKFKYNHRNQLIEEEDALGNKINYEYDAVGNTILVTDKKGYKTHYTYDLLNRLIEEKDEYGNSTEYQYEEYSGNPLVSGGKALPTLITDKNNNITEIEYDDKYRKIKETDAEKNSTEYELDDNGNIIEITDALNRKTKFKYDKRNRKVELTDSYNNKEKYEYNKTGQIIELTDKNNHITKTFYDKLNRPVRVRNHLGYEIENTYDKNSNKVQFTDAENNKTYFKYDKENRLIEQKNAAGDKKTYVYNKVGKKISETDEKGNKTQYVYDDLYRLIDTEGAAGFLIEHLEYDANDNIILKEDAEGNETIYDYDKLNRLIKETNALDDYKTFEYDAVGNLIKQVDERSNKTEFTYNKTNKLLRTIDSYNKYIENTYDELYNITSIRDKKGNITKKIYDNLNRPVKVVRADDTSSEITYDSIGNITEQKDFNGNIITLTYDALNRKTQEKDPYNNVITFSYDKNNNLISSTDKRENIFKTEYDMLNRKVKDIDPYNNETTYEYEKNGNLKSICDPNGLSTTFEYDSLNRKIKEIDHRGESISYVYDKNSNIINITDKNGFKTEKGYDALNRLINLKEDSTNINKETKYQYDKVGNRTGITDSNNNFTKFEYDMLNRLIKHTFPDNNFYQFTYDDEGNIIEKLTPNGVTIIQTFDELNRLKTKNLGVEGVWSYSYDGNNNLLTAVNPHATYVNTYDALNRLRESLVNYTEFGELKTISYTYDIDSNPDIVNTFSGKTIDYNFDPLNRLTAVTSHNGQSASFTYDNGSRMTSKNLSNSVNTNFSYDNLNRLLESQSSVLTIQQNYDKESNKLFERLSFDSVSKADQFNYDSLYRVTGTKYGVSSSLTSGVISETNQPTAPAYEEITEQEKTQESVLDKEHNRITHSSDGSSESYTVNSMNQYTQVSDSFFIYDKNGNLIQDDKFKYEYDPENRLINLKDINDNLIASYHYGPNGKRILKETDGKKHFYYYDADWNLSSEYIDNELVREYTYSGIDQPVTATVNLDILNINPEQLSLDPATKSIDYFYHQNSIQNVLALTDINGEVICRYNYDIDGTVNYLDKDGNDINLSSLDLYKQLNEFLFQGRQIDSESELYYFRNRYYSPDLSRFITTDPLDYVDGMNLYAYVNGNVVNLIDPMGLYGWTDFKNWAKNTRFYRRREQLGRGAVRMFGGGLRAATGSSIVVASGVLTYFSGGTVAPLAWAAGGSGAALAGHGLADFSSGLGDTFAGMFLDKEFNTSEHFLGSKGALWFDRIGLYGDIASFAGTLKTAAVKSKQIYQLGKEIIKKQHKTQTLKLAKEGVKNLFQRIKYNQKIYKHLFDDAIGGVSKEFARLSKYQKDAKKVYDALKTSTLTNVFNVISIALGADSVSGDLERIYQIKGDIQSLEESINRNLQEQRNLTLNYDRSEYYIRKYSSEDKQDELIKKAWNQYDERYQNIGSHIDQLESKKQKLDEML